MLLLADSVRFIIPFTGTVDISIGSNDAITFTAKHLAEIQEILKQNPKKTK